MPALVVIYQLLSRLLHHRGNLLLGKDAIANVAINHNVCPFE